MMHFKIRLLKKLNGFIYYGMYNILKEKLAYLIKRQRHPL